MSKLEKIFLAILVALFVLVAAEAMFIFVYKPKQTITSTQSVTPDVTQTPDYIPAINSQQMKTLKDWPYFRNATLKLTETVTGTVSTITPQTQTTPLIIVLDGVKRKDTTTFLFPEKTLSQLTVYTRDLKTGLDTKSDIESIQPKDNIIIELITDLGAEPAESDLGGSIYIIK